MNKLNLIAAGAVLFASLGAVAHAGDADSVYGEEWRSVLQNRPGSYGYGLPAMQQPMPARSMTTAAAVRTGEGRSCPLDTRTTLTPSSGQDASSGIC